jgi:hypothetical protein
MKRRRGLPRPELAPGPASPYPAAMNQRTRKALGIVATVAFMLVYALVLMAVGGMLVVGRGTAFELPFYILAGLGWLPVVMAIIRWMSKPDVA